MTLNRSVILGLMLGIAFLLLSVAVYSPVLMAWMDRDGGRPDNPSPTDLIVVRHSWIMRKASFLYVPLVRLQALAHGYRLYEESHIDGEVVGLIFYPKDTVIRE